MSKTIEILTSNKITKSAAQYGKGMKSSHCGICAYFDSPNKCSKVIGDVDSSGWCKLFKKSN